MQTLNEYLKEKLQLRLKKVSQAIDGNCYFLAQTELQEVEFLCSRLNQLEDEKLQALRGWTQVEA